jgi:hypothetical protein
MTDARQTAPTQFAQAIEAAFVNQFNEWSFARLCPAPKMRSGVHAAIDGHARAGFRTCDECHHRGDLFHMPITIERGLSLLRHRPVARRGVQFRIDGAGLNVIDGNASVPHF